MGSNGTVLHYDGRVWTLGSPIGTLNLQSIAGSSSTDAWAVSAEGSLVRYNGTLWQVQMPPYAQALQDVAMASSSQGLDRRQRRPDSALGRQQVDAVPQQRLAGSARRLGGPRWRGLGRRQQRHPCCAG